MNPQYLNQGHPPLPNNNMPAPIPQNIQANSFKGQNANIYGNQPMEMAQKMQNMNLNGPQPGQMPPNQYPPSMHASNFQTANGQSQRINPLIPNSNSNQSSIQQNPSQNRVESQPPVNMSSAHHEYQHISHQQPISQGQQAPQKLESSHDQTQLTNKQNQMFGQQNSQPGLLAPISQSNQQSSPGRIQPQQASGHPMTSNQSVTNTYQQPPMQSMSGQQAPTGLQNLPQNHQLPPVSQQQNQISSNQRSFNSGQPPMPGQQPTMLGQPHIPGMPPMPNQASSQSQQQQPMHYGQQGPISGRPPMPMQQPQSLGQQPPLPGQHPAISSQQPMPGQQTGPQSLMPGQQPPIPGQQPPMPGQQLPMPGQQPSMPGQQPPMPGQQPPMPGQRQPMPGQQPPMPSHQPPQSGQMPPMPGQQQPPMPGQQPPPMPGQQPPPMPGQQQPPMPGQQQQPFMPGQQPPLPGQQPQFPGQQLRTGMQSQLPHMPPPLSQNRGGMPPAPGQFPAQQQYPGIQQQYPAQQQAQYPGQQQPQYPGQQQPQYPGQQQSQFPGQQPSQPGAHPYPGYQQQQPPRRLNPDEMPSPIEVINDDQQNRSGVFATSEPGVVPPLASTDFVVDDQGNASPRFIRSSMYSVPVTADAHKQVSVPFCLVISPMARTVGPEREPPLVDFAAMTGSPNLGPVRCSRCKAYMCPSMKFIDGGRHFKCAFCKATTEVPMEYTQYINTMQQYGRSPVEMSMGAYEIVATKDYCRNNALPNPPAVIFLIDVSYNSVKCGLVHTICENIKNMIEAIPKEDGRSTTRVGFITYASTVHFYNIKGTLCQPQMLSVGDVNEMFVPILEGFLVKPEESGQVLDTLMQQIPRMFGENKETEIILLPAIEAGLEAFKAADTVGQLYVFHTSLPSYPAPGKLINRDDRKSLGTEKEKAVLAPATTAYNELGQSLAAAGVSVELFICNNNYVDVATIGQLCRLTGGSVNKYTYFQADVDGQRLVSDVMTSLSRPTAFDAVLRVRTSTGIRATDFYGHMFMSNTTDVELAAIDADKAIGVEIKHDDKLTSEDGVYIQTALLYTHRSGQRRLRILNLNLNIARELSDVFRCIELDTLMNFFAKQSIWNLREATPRAVKEALTNRCVRTLTTYRKFCASPTSAAQLVLPESMKLLPLYVGCLLRNDALSGGPELTVDERATAMARMLSADVQTSNVNIYPRLLSLMSLPATPQLTRCTFEKMKPHGIYLLENAVHLMIWVGLEASPEFLQDLFGVKTSQQIDSSVTELPELDNEISLAARDIVDKVRLDRRRCMRLTVIRQGDKLEAVFKQLLVEDPGPGGAVSYGDFLCHVHKEIRALL